MTTKTYIIAEIAQGFEGNPWLCKKFIELAKKSGADAVKFQIFRASEVCTEDYVYNELFNSLEIDPKIWTELISYSKSIGIDFISDVVGIETYDWISKTDITSYKIHSTDLKNYPLLKHIGNRKHRIYVGIGGSTAEEIAKAITLLGDSDLVLLTGFQAEPNLLVDVELDKIKLLQKMFNLPVGYADHIDANEDLAVVLPSMAVLAGASTIEKHLTIDRNNLQIEDYISALNSDEFIRMVNLIRNVEQFPSQQEYKLSDREIEYRKKSKRVILAAKDIPAGHTIDASDITLLRTGTPAEILDIDEVVHKQTKRAFKKLEVITKTELI